MKVVKKTAEYSIYQKRNGRYAVKDANKKWLNAEEKIKVLVEAGLVKVVIPAPVAEAEPEAAEEAPAEVAAEDAGEAEADPAE